MCASSVMCAAVVGMYGLMIMHCCLRVCTCVVCVLLIKFFELAVLFYCRYSGKS